MKIEKTEGLRELIIALAKCVDIDFYKNISCLDCFYHNQKNLNDCLKFQHPHVCWEKHKVETELCDLDDMSHKDYIVPYEIKDVVREANQCDYYKSGLDEYKKLYNESKKELDKLKEDIRIICK